MGQYNKPLSVQLHGEDLVSTIPSTPLFFPWNNIEEFSDIRVICFLNIWTF